MDTIEGWQRQLGGPVIAFLQIEQGEGGKTRSKVVVARANVATPAGPEDFRFEDADVEEDNPCRDGGCGTGACVKATGLCSPTITGCTPAACGDGKACVSVEEKATCVAVQGPVTTYPNVFGGYIALAEGGGQLGIALYDRPHGNLVALLDRGDGTWERVIVDGETGSRQDQTAIDTGDVGIATSLAIDASGVWHMTYVSGLDESLRYVTLEDGKPGKSEVIDDGSSVDGDSFPDGKHVVGDDSAVRADGDSVTVYYQDATAGTLRQAVGARDGTSHAWTRRTIAQPDRFAGFFPQIIPGEDKVANFWRATDRNAKTVIGDVAILAP